MKTEQTATIDFTERFDAGKCECCDVECSHMPALPLALCSLCLLVGCNFVDTHCAHTLNAR